MKICVQAMARVEFYIISYFVFWNLQGGVSRYFTFSIFCSPRAALVATASILPLALYCLSLSAADVAERLESLPVRMCAVVEAKSMF